jgi:hypothetical protein
MGHMTPDGSYYCVCCEVGKSKARTWLFYGLAIGFAVGSASFAVLLSLG